MASRLTTNQEIAGSTPAVVIDVLFLTLFYTLLCAACRPLRLFSICVKDLNNPIFITLRGISRYRKVHTVRHAQIHSALQTIT
jgi:hypothetical protein